jgi:hypothetical protein
MLIVNDLATKRAFDWRNRFLNIFDANKFEIKKKYYLAILC